MAALSLSKGYSLLELLVALALGVIISAAGLEMFVSSQQSAGFQRGMSDIQSSGRFAMDFMRDDLRRAGDQTVSDPTPAVIMFAADSPGGAAGNLSTNAGTAGINQNDQLVTRFFSAEPGLDCEGNAYAKEVYVTSRYFVRTDAGTGLPALACDASTDNKTTVTGADTGQVIIAGVDSFQVLYGVDDGVVPALPAPPGVAGEGLGVARVNRYLTATQYQALAVPRPVILSVRFGLLLASTDQLAGNARLAAASDYLVLDNLITAATVPVDGRSRRLFVGTIALKNFDSSGV